MDTRFPWGDYNRVMQVYKIGQVRMDHIWSTFKFNEDSLAIDYDVLDKEGETDPISGGICEKICKFFKKTIY